MKRFRSAKCLLYGEKIRNKMPIMKWEDSVVKCLLFSEKVLKHKMPII